MTTENDPRFPICLVLDLTSCDADFEEDALSFFNGEMAEDHWMYAKFTEIFAGMTSFEYSNSVIDFMRGLETEAFNSFFEHADGSKGTTILVLLGAAIAAFAIFLFMLRRFEHIPFFKKVREFFLGMMDGLKSIFRLKRSFLFWLYSFGIWFFWLLMTFTSLLALQETCAMTLRQTVFFMAAGSLGMMVPTPGGAGAFHGMAILSLQALGFPLAAGKIYALISWSIKTAWDILVGAVSFLIATNKK